MYSVYLDFLALSKEEQKKFLEKIKAQTNKSRTKTRRKSRQMKG